ncbi:hypothetical protein ANCCAN_17530 [Ancylostoma caninum]|uniref:Uncharacterized protein n=1 Tax=Ancylostoma caninum TaxID=29170 RepID=A0A368FZZ5_ANCCA|nr:hypothetical protein ANCCAN_17530 [Ancylostoma caninum]
MSVLISSLSWVVLSFLCNSRGKGVPITELSKVMDSPPDLSPNAPPTGFEEPSNYFANLQATPAPPSASSTGQASTEGSVDSSGFEKVDHDVLEEYGQQFVNQMQQSLFGKLPEADSSVSCTFHHGFAGDSASSFPSVSICHRISYQRNLFLVLLHITSYLSTDLLGK